MLVIVLCKRLFIASGEPRFNYVATRYSESGFAGFLIPPALREDTIFNNNLYLLKITLFNPGSRWITLFIAPYNKYYSYKTENAYFTNKNIVVLIFKSKRFFIHFTDADCFKSQINNRFNFI